MPWNPIGLWDVEDRTFSRKSAHRWRWGCQPFAPAVLYIQDGSLFPVPIPTTGWVNPRDIVRLEEFCNLKKKLNDLIEIWTRVLSSCSIKPQPCKLHTKQSQKYKPRYASFHGNGLEGQCPQYQGSETTTYGITAKQTCSSNLGYGFSRFSIKQRGETLSITLIFLLTII
jgi:hypothetical protein